MHIVEDSATRLRLKESSGFLPLVLLAGAVLVVATTVARHSDPRQFISGAIFAASALFFRRVSEVDVNGSTRRCEIHRVDMWKSSEKSIPFDDVLDVAVEVQKPDTSVLVDTRLAFKTAEGMVPLTAGYLASLDAHIALREKMVDIIFDGRARPPALDPVQVMIDGGRPIAAERRRRSMR